MSFICGIPMYGGVSAAGSGGGGNSVIAKSVVFDIADNHGGTFMGIRSIEFKLSGSLLTPGFTADATSQFSSTFASEHAFDTSLSKTGSFANTEWMAGSGRTQRQRLIVVFDSNTEFDEIAVNNAHHNGGDTGRGADNVKITWSPDAITDTTYDVAVSNGTVLNNTQWPEHIASDAADDQTVWSAG